jgi:hypothetical protein
MNVGGLPTGTVSSGRDDAGASSPRDRSSDADPETRIAELKRENEALRAAVEKQRRENERIVERYERLLEQDRNCDDPATEAQSSTDDDSASADADPGATARIARFFGL